MKLLKTLSKWYICIPLFFIIYFISHIGSITNPIYIGITLSIGVISFFRAIKITIAIFILELLAYSIKQLSHS